MLWTSRRVFFAPSASVFWCLNLTGGGACSWGAQAALFCLWNLLTNFLQGLRSALLLMFSEMSPASEQGHNNCSRYPEAHLIILVWMDFPSPEAARQRRTCFFWSWGDCGHRPAWNRCLDISIDIYSCWLKLSICQFVRRYMMTQGNDDELHEIIASNCDKDRVMWVRVKEEQNRLSASYKTLAVISLAIDTCSCLHHLYSHTIPHLII